MNAIIHLACTLGLRPIEISLISLDDISFNRREIVIRHRKNNNPIKLPIPENTIKAIAAYIIGARPESKERMLFLQNHPPFMPISTKKLRNEIAGYMRKIGLTATPYWLRHTYAQNLLEQGVSIYVLKQMLGHDSIQTTKRYITIHTKLMRKILFDETV